MNRIRFKTSNLEWSHTVAIFLKLHIHRFRGLAFRQTSLVLYSSFIIISRLWRPSARNFGFPKYVSETYICESVQRITRNLQIHEESAFMLISVRSRLNRQQSWYQTSNRHLIQLDPWCWVSVSGIRSTCHPAESPDIIQGTRHTIADLMHSRSNTL